MATLTCKKKNGSLFVVFGTDTSVRYSSKLKSALAKIISIPVDNYYLDLGDVEETDITFIQLLIAFHERIRKQNRSMFLSNTGSASGFITTAAQCGVDIHSLFEIEDCK